MLGFYEEYHGHKSEHIELLIKSARQQSKNIIFLAGDSTLDNKVWLLKSNIERGPAPKIYDQFMDSCVKDVAYNLNLILSDDYMCINCAVEESSLNEHNTTSIIQDNLIRENIQENDILVVSVGGNDVILKPTLQTIMSLGALLLMNDYYNTIPYQYICKIFHQDLNLYIKYLTDKSSPKDIVICSPYFPHEANVDSWANTSLKLLGYDNNPQKIHKLIRDVHRDAIEKIEIGYKVALCDVLDSSKESNDYLFRVEPSDVGGSKIAHEIIKLLNI